MVAEPVDRYRARDPRWAMASDVPANIDPNITAQFDSATGLCVLNFFDVVLVRTKKREL